MYRKIVNYFKNFAKKDPFVSILVPIVTAGILLSMAVCFQKPSEIITALPLFVSIVIMMLQADANRYAFLLGSINSVFYGAVYFVFTLHSSALSALLISFPIQLLTFLRWNKRKYKNSTLFTRLSWPMRGLCLIAGVAAVLILNSVLGRLGSEYIILDNITTVLGIFTYIFTFFSLVEYPMLQIAGTLIGSVNYFSMIRDGNLTLVPHLIYNIYCILCITKATVSVCKLYREQCKKYLQGDAENDKCH